MTNLAIITNNQGLQSALNTQFLFQIGVFTAIPMIMGFILEQGVLNVYYNISLVIYAVVNLQHRYNLLVMNGRQLSVL